MIICSICNEHFSSVAHLHRHAKNCGTLSQFKCNFCSSVFNRRDNLHRHCKNAHINTSTPRIPPTILPAVMAGTSKRKLTTTGPPAKRQKCEHCDIPFENKRKCLAHIRKFHLDKITIKLEDGVDQILTAFKNRISTFRLAAKGVDVVHCLTSLHEKIRKLVEDARIAHNSSIKFNIELFAAYIQPATEEMEIKSFNTKMRVVTESSDLDDIIHNFFATIKMKSEEFQVIMHILLAFLTNFHMSR